MTKMAIPSDGDPNPVGERTEASPQKPIDDDYSRRMAMYWKSQIEAADEENERWHKRGDQIIKRFRDERDRATEEGQKRVNALWSWHAIMRPAIYARCPNAVCERRFLDRDPVGRTSAMILERALRFELEMNGFHQGMKRAVDDYLLPGRGILWVRYEPEIGETGTSLPPMAANDMTDAQGEIAPPDESQKTEKLEATGEQLLTESAPVDYIQWKDFYVLPPRARTWAEVQTVGKKIYASKQECIEFFGEIGGKIQADATLSVAERAANTNTSIFQDFNERKRVIIELWNKVDRKVYWISTGSDDLLREEDDPLDLEGFFPVPEPLSAVMTNDTMIPVPFYIEWQDQAQQLDELTQRIAMLSKACKVAGTYDAANRPLRRLLDESVENELIPVENWAMHKEKGGVEGSISFLPIKQVVDALEVLIETRDKILQDLDRVTGISDVLRGTSDARETLGAQRLKSSAAGTRIDDQRNEVGKFACGVVALVAEIIAKHFSDETLIQSSGILQEEGIADMPMGGMMGGAPSMGMPPPS